MVLKGKENWELAKDAALKPADGSELKVGDKVTLHYTMTAKSVDKKTDARKEKKPMDAKPKAAASPTASPAASPASSPQKPAAQVSPSPKA